MVSSARNTAPSPGLQCTYRHICHGVHNGRAIHNETALSRAIRIRLDDSDMQSSRDANKTQLAQWIQTRTVDRVQIPATPSSQPPHDDSKRK